MRFIRGRGLRADSDRHLPDRAAAQQLRPSRGAQNPAPIDRHYQTVRLGMEGVFPELGIAARSSTIFCRCLHLTALHGLGVSDGVFGRPYRLELDTVSDRSERQPSVQDRLLWGLKKEILGD
jgi:hypothetical protein